MLKSLTAALKLSTIRESLNDLNAVTELSDTQKTEERDLLASQKKTESEYRSAIAEEDDARTTPTAPDTETRERLALVARASIGAIFSAAVEHRALDGVESDPGRSLARARRASRDHPGTYARWHKRATDPDADLRGW